MGCGPGCGDRWTPNIRQSHRPPKGGWTLLELPSDIPDVKLHKVWANRRIIHHQNAKVAVQEMERFLKQNGIKPDRTKLRDHATAVWRRRDPDRFPKSKADRTEASMFDMAFNLAKAVVKAGGALIKGEAVLTENGEAARRLTICIGCENFIEAEKRCRECGCFIEYKKLLATEQCPIGKW